MLWSILCRNKPAKCEENRKSAKLAFQDMWIAGTLGVFFVALMSNLPTHLGQITWPGNSQYTLQVLLNYAYLLWFLFYFFISNLSNSMLRKSRKRDLFFDVAQSFAAFYAAFKLGFIALSLDFSFSAYSQASCSIFIICLLSLIVFGWESNKDINLIRVYGAVIALVSCCAAKNFASGQYGEVFWLYFVLAVLLVTLWLLLWPFIWIRIDEAESTPGL
ncbi:hypothetical protein [Lacimicrobium alkaliphilum]|uniref:Uncharacterized protein n=1 Tax=Lacimicrobium alkaliphilum TaxID=1526571 RepID=A0A0U2PFB4_9ALTE|nr:hypothetical protein [Lacimicrobium alkaliphilum]ALS97981.1 hypothetical protein AT746_06690 [Lacimicrobium alkaliphilum]